MSLTSGTAPAIELFETRALRGGGGGESREWGRYAVAVCSFRFDDNCSRLPELKFRRVKGQVRRVVTPVLAANLKLLAEDEVRGTAHRCIDMMSEFSYERWLSVFTKSLTTI